MNAAESIRIATATPGRELPQDFHGVNFVALWNSDGASPAARAAVARLGTGTVRFPGGVPCQWYDWQEPTNTGWTTITPADAWALAQAGGGAVVFQTNTAGDRSGTNETTGEPWRLDNSAAHQVAWLRAARDQGMRVAAWEIGNEPELDAPEAVRADPEATYRWYNERFAEQARALKAADPAAIIMGPASANTWFWWAQENLRRFLEVHGNRQGSGLVDAVSVHWYPEPQDRPWEEVRAQPQEWQRCHDFLRTTIEAWDNRPLPLVISEWSWGGTDKNRRNGTMANALGCADIVGMFTRTSVTGHMHFCLQRVERGWGLLGMGADDSKPIGHPAPVFYGLWMATRLMGRVLPIASTADPAHRIASYATVTVDGAVTVLLINKDGVEQTIDLHLDGLEIQTATAERYLLVPDDGTVEARAVKLNGIRDPLPGPTDWPAAQRMPGKDALTPLLPPYAMMLLRFAPAAP